MLDTREEKFFPKSHNYSDVHYFLLKNIEIVFKSRVEIPGNIFSQHF